MRRRQAFIMRFWQEAGERGVTEWRGIVIHVLSGERIPVRSLEEATQIVASYLSSSLQDDEGFMQGNV